MKIEKLRNPYVSGNEGCSVSMIDLLEKINEIIDAMNGEHEPADIYSEDGRLIAKKDESDDERIRRTLVEYFGPEVQLDFVRGVPIQKIRDWLEKQKERKPVMGNGISEQTKMDETVYKFTPEEWKKALDEQLPKDPKPAGWSEEDKKILDDVSHILIGLNYKQIAKDYKQAVEKLIYARPSWKPSEEQMGALQHAIDACESEWDYQDDELRSLLNDIKKL